jgi:hypothetical protein
MGTITREYLDWMYFQGVQLLDLDIHTAHEVFAGVPRTTGMRIDVSKELDFDKPKNRTGETYIDSDDEDSGTTHTIKTVVYAGPPGDPFSIVVYVYYHVDRYGEVTTSVEKIEHFVDIDGTRLRRF